MGGGGKKVNTALMDASLARQEEAIRKQEEAMTRREEEVRAKEQATEEARRRARGVLGTGRAMLLGTSERGTLDQEPIAGLSRKLGG